MFLWDSGNRLEVWCTYIGVGWPGPVHAVTCPGLQTGCACSMRAAARTDLCRCSMNHLVCPRPALNVWWWCLHGAHACIKADDYILMPLHPCRQNKDVDSKKKVCLGQTSCLRIRHVRTCLPSLLQAVHYWGGIISNAPVTDVAY